MGTTYYWNPAADSAWYDGATATWATTDGGTPAIVNPTSADNCYFTATNSHKCTISATANCNNLYFDNADNGGLGDYVGTLAGSSNIGVYGSLAMSGGAMTNSFTGSFFFNATSGTNTIRCNGFSLVKTSFQGAGTFQLADNYLGAGMIFSAGTFSVNGKTVTLNGNNNSIQITVSPTFYNLTVTPTTPSKTDVFTVYGNFTVTNNLTISDGATLTNRVLVSSSVVGTPRTITCTGASVNYSNTDFQDITIVDGTLGTNSSVGDCGGNTGITFTGNVDQHWVGTIANSGTGTWLTAANWTSRVPLPQDNVYMNFAFGTSCTVSADMPRLGKSIDWTGATWTTALTWTDSLGISVYGSLKLLSGMTISGWSTAITFAGRGSYQLTSAGNTFVKAVNVNAPTGTLQLQDDLVVSGNGNQSTLGNGTFDANNHNVTMGLFLANAGTVLMGSGTWTMTGTGSVFQAVTAVVLTAGTSTIKHTDTSNTAITFSGFSHTYNNIYFSRGASTGSITITGSNTFNDFKDDGTAAHSIIFTNSTTQTVSNFEVMGSNGNPIALINSSGTTVANLTYAGSTYISACDWLNISYINVSPTTLTWYAGANSNKTAGSDTGWIFTAAPAKVYTMVTAPASFAYTPQSSGDYRVMTMITAPATFTLTGMASGFKRVMTMITAHATYTLTGMAAGTKKIMHLITAPATYVLTGMGVGLHKAIVMVTAPAVFILTGMSIFISKSGIIKPIIKLINIIKPKFQGIIYAIKPKLK